jgi:hypothetical protein
MILKIAMQSDTKVIKIGSVIQSDYLQGRAEVTPCLSIHDAVMPQNLKLD